MNENKPLLERQKKFAEEFVRCGNGKEAYHIAYPDANEKTCETNSYALLRKPNVAAYIDELNRELTKERIADLDECLELLTSFMRDETATKSERTKAAELRMKSLAAFIDKKQIDAKLTADIYVDIEEEQEEE